MEKAFFNIGLKYFIRFLRQMVLLSIVLVPGILCYMNILHNQCLIFGTPYFQYSIMFSIIILAVFVSHLVVLSLTVFVRNNPFLVIILKDFHS